MYIYIFVFFICSFFIIKHSKSAFYVKKSNLQGEVSFILTQLFGNFPPIIKRVSFFLSHLHPFFCLNHMLLCSWSLYRGHSVVSLVDCLASVWDFQGCGGMGVSSGSFLINGLISYPLFYLSAIFYLNYIVFLNNCKFLDY